MTHTLKRAADLQPGDTILWYDMAAMKHIEHVVSAVEPQRGSPNERRVTVAPHGVTADKVTWLLEVDERVKVKGGR